MTIANRWIFFGVMVIGLFYGFTPLGAQPTDDESAPTQGEPTLIQGESMVTEEEKPWIQGSSSERRQTARVLFLEGNRLFRNLLFAKAAEQYAAALVQWKHPAFYFNQALALLNLGKEVEAHESLELALRYGEEPLGTERFQEARKQFQALERQLGRIRVSCQTQGAEVTLDGVPLFTGPGSYQGWVKAKDYELTAKRAGYLSEARRVTVTSGSFQDIDLRLVTLSQATEASRRWAAWKPWMVVAVGGATTAAAGGLHVVAYRNFKHYDEQFQNRTCAQGPRSSGCSEEDIGRGLNARLIRARRQQNIAQGGYVVGGAVIAGGVALLYLNRPRLTERGGLGLSGDSVTLIPMLSGNELGISVGVNR